MVSNFDSVKPFQKRTLTQQKVLRRLRRIAKVFYHMSILRPDELKTILFIVGCQRSGTDLMTWIFERDWRTKVYPEVSKLSSRHVPARLRLNPLTEIKAEIGKERAPLIVLKPLVESQRTPELLTYFCNSKALWLYRNYKAVARSHVRKWGGQNSIRDLRAIVEQKANNWRYEKVSDELRDIVVEYFDEDMNDYDAAALYWFVRNSLFFDLQLDKDSRVMLCQYEALVQSPVPVVRRIYNFLESVFPGCSIVAEVSADSVDKGQDIGLSPAIDRLCQNLLARLDATWIREHTPIATIQSEQCPPQQL